MPEPAEVKQVTFSPVTMTIAAVLIGAPGVGGLIQSNNANTALNQIEMTLMNNLDARRYLESGAGSDARVKERLLSLTRQLEKLEISISKLEISLEIKIQSSTGGLTNRLNRMDERIDRIGSLVAAKLQMPPVPQIIPQQLFLNSTKRLIETSLIK